MSQDQSCDKNEEQIYPPVPLQKTMSFGGQEIQTQKKSANNPFPTIQESPSQYEQSGEKNQTESLQLSEYKVATDNGSAENQSPQNKSTKQVSQFNGEKCGLGELVKQLLSSLPISEKVFQRKNYDLTLFQKITKEEKQPQTVKQSEIFIQMRQKYIDKAENLQKQFQTQQASISNLEEINLSHLNKSKEKFLFQKQTKQPKSQQPIKMEEQIQQYVSMYILKNLIKIDNQIMFCPKSQSPSPPSSPNHSTNPPPPPPPKESENKKKNDIKVRKEPSFKLDYSKLRLDVDNQCLVNVAANLQSTIVPPNVYSLPYGFPSSINPNILNQNPCNPNIYNQNTVNPFNQNIVNPNMFNNVVPYMFNTTNPILNQNPGNPNVYNQNTVNPFNQNTVNPNMLNPVVPNMFNTTNPNIVNQNNIIPNPVNPQSQNPVNQNVFNQNANPTGTNIFQNNGTNIFQNNTQNQNFVGQAPYQNTQPQQQQTNQSEKRYGTRSGQH